MKCQSKWPYCQFAVLWSGAGPSLERSLGGGCIFIYSGSARLVSFEIKLISKEVNLLAISGDASPTFGHANANFSVFIDRIRNQFLKK